MRMNEPPKGRSSAALAVRGKDESDWGLIGRINREALVWSLDGAALDPTTTSADLGTYLDRCARAGIKAVCVLPCHLVEARRWITDHGWELDLCGVVDFPLGANPIEEKVAEAGRLIARGADELDAVMSLGLLRAGRNDRVLEELWQLRTVAGSRVLKIIIETPLLSNGLKVRAAELCLEAGVDYVKTSTGFHGPVKPADVQLIREVVGTELDIKVAGGIRTLGDVARFFEAGANRIGASAAPEIVAEFDRLQGE
ncbi:deoxyribose-phosphate aldolase [bacterium]|nr:deoxyribose-phosphate aldolase [bacterium]